MEPVTTAFVKIWGRVVGAVAWERGRPCAEFEYEPSFLKTGLDLSPIHMGIQEARRSPRFSFPGIDPLTFHGLPGLLANSLPDLFGNKIIDAWLRRHGRDPRSFNSVERLCYIGSRGMGALEFEPQISSKKLNAIVPVDVQNLLELAQEVLAERSKMDVRIKNSDPDKEKAEALINILRVGLSAGGAVAKAVIAMNENGHIVSGQSAVPEGYEHWLLKFDGVSGHEPEFGQSFDNGRVEFAYYLMARQAGIDMMECKLLEENGRAHFLTKRFDRVGNEKKHVLSLASIGHFGWNPVGSVGYEDAFYVMRELHLPYPDQEQQFRRMVFNVAAQNIDDHTKNISYMMHDDGVWQLSPAYDVTFTLDSAELLGDRHKMSINGKQKGFTIEDFETVAQNMGINDPAHIIEEVVDAVEHWPQFAAAAGVRPDVAAAVGKLFLEDDDEIGFRPR